MFADGAYIDPSDAGSQKNAGAGFHGGARRVDIVDENDRGEAGKQVTVCRIDGKSFLQIVQSGLWPELFLRRRIDLPQKQIAGAWDVQQNGEISGKKFRLVVSALPAFVAMDGYRDEGVRFPAQNIASILPAEFPGKKLGKCAAVVIFESCHGRAGLFIVNKKRNAAPEAFWENAAVIAVFLLG